MFNPEGVKGRTTQPPHKIFNFMAQFAIERERVTTNTEGVPVYTTKEVARFSSAEEALDTLCRQAHRHGYEVTIDNSTMNMGFCLWQIQVQVGQWTYRTVELCDAEFCEAMGVDEFGWPITGLE